MKPNAIPLACCLFLAQAPIHAQMTLPYTTGFDDPAGQEGWCVLRKGISTTLSWDYASGGAPSSPNFLWHDYAVNEVATDTTCDWFISPAFDFIEGARLSGLKLNVNSISGEITPADGLGIYLLVGSGDPTQAAAILPLGDLTPFIAGTSDWIEGPHPMILPRAGECHIAIKYQATTNPFTVSIDDITIEPLQTGIADAASMASDVRLYPNPSDGSVAVATDASVEGVLRLRLFDARGAVVEDRMMSANGPVQLRPSAGEYGYVITDRHDHPLRKGTLVLTR